MSAKMEKPSRYRGLRRLINRAVRLFMYKLYLPAVYKRAAKKPLDPDKAVFVEVRRPELTNSLSLIYERCEKEGKRVSLHILRYSVARAPTLIKSCAALMRDIGDAGCVFIDDACEAMGCFKRRDGQKIVQVWHGCGAFKRFSFSTADLIFGYDRKEMLRYPCHVNYTLVPVSGEASIAAYREAFNLGDDPENIVRSMGVSRTDVFFDADFLASAAQKVYDAVPAAKGKKVMLYAPTFRGSVSYAAAPELPDVRRLKEEFGGEYVLLIKQHYLIADFPAVPEDCKDFAFDVSKTLGIDELLITADVCIADYSSLVFEYSLMGRPMVFFAPDVDDYCDWRGFYWDYREFVPGPIVSDTEELIKALRCCGSDFKEKTAAFKKLHMTACDGRSTDRLMEYAFGQDKY